MVSDMRNTELAMKSAMWAAAIMAQPTDVGPHAVASHEWTIVESHCWSLVHHISTVTNPDY